ncbi:MAG TPA: DMT family transporter, partial [Alphaproteobacteria bacterium]|nr:DMT family transporter [Alphaproteobacteria bacterium]
PLAVSFWRHLGAGAIMLAIAAARVRLRLPRADLIGIAALGVLQFGLFAYLFAAALQYVSSARGALVLSTMPILTMAIAAAMGRERLSVLRAAGGLIGIAGVSVALGDRASDVGSEVWKGDLLMFAAAIAGSLYNVLSGVHLRRHAALAVVAIQLPIAAATTLLVLSVGGGFSGLWEFEARGWLALVFLMSFGGALCFYMWMWALERTQASQVAIAVTINPIAAAILGALVLAEPITERVVIGLVGVVAGIVLVNWPTRSAANAAGDIRARGE